MSTRGRCPGNSRNTTLFGFAAAVRFDEVSAGGAETAQGLHDPARVLTGAHGDLCEGVTVPAVEQGAGLSVLTAPLSLPVPVTLSVPLPFHGRRVGGVKEGVIDWGVVPTQAVLGAQAGGERGAGGVQSIGYGRVRVGVGLGSRG